MAVLVAESTGGRTTRQFEQVAREVGRRYALLVLGLEFSGNEQLIPFRFWCEVGIENRVEQ